MVVAGWGKKVMRLGEGQERAVPAFSSRNADGQVVEGDRPPDFASLYLRLVDSISQVLQDSRELYAIGFGYARAGLRSAALLLLFSERHLSLGQLGKAASFSFCIFIKRGQFSFLCTGGIRIERRSNSISTLKPS